MTDRTPLLDAAVVAELRESVGGDDAFVRELAEAYLAEGLTHVEAMLAAARADDAAAIVRPAHTLKSSSAALGALRLADRCREIEHAGREGRVASLADVEAVRSMWDMTVEAMKGAGLA
ncbi:hypothetical protein BH24CHL5_BH24CHL5_13130 [soil metagenome]